jgi:hypothetical protein
MKISGSQWLILIATDFFLRAAFTYGSTLDPSAVVVAVIISLLHLFTLSVSCQLIRCLMSSSTTAVFVMALVENIAFAAVFFAFALYLGKSGRQTSCGGPEVGCEWIEGVITATGVRTMVVIVLFQILINIIVVGIVAGHAWYLARISGAGKEN